MEPTVPAVQDAPPAHALPSPLAEHTTLLIGLAASRVRRVMQDVMPSSAKALPRDYAILTALTESDACSQQDLATRLNINRTVMVKLVDRLQAVGYLARARNPDDRRSYTLTLTEQGRAAQHVMGPAIAKGEAELNAPLTPDQRHTLADLLRRLLPDLDDLPHPPRQRTGYLITQADLRLRRRTDHALAPLALQTRHFAVLTALAALEPCPQQHLARTLAMTETAIVPIIDDLHHPGLLQRTRDPRDRRRYALTLTPHGHTTLTTATHAVDTIRTDIIHTLGTPAEHQLRTLLHHLTTNTSTSTSSGTSSGRDRDGGADGGTPT
jgi:DNA-binding MarR family transcriptional regulator